MRARLDPALTFTSSADLKVTRSTTHGTHTRLAICAKTRSIVLRCVPHNMALCVSCLFVHDDPGTCTYVLDSEKRRHWQGRQAAIGKGKS